MKQQKINMKEIGQKIAEINNQEEAKTMTIKFVERWEERIYRITEVIHVDEDGESFGAPFYKDVELHEVTDSGDIRSEDLDKLAKDHWVHKHLKIEEEIKP